MLDIISLSTFIKSRFSIERRARWALTGTSHASDEAPLPPQCNSSLWWRAVKGGAGWWSSWIWSWTHFPKQRCVEVQLHEGTVPRCPAGRSPNIQCDQCLALDTRRPVFGCFNIQIHLIKERVDMFNISINYVFHDTSGCPMRHITVRCTLCLELLLYMCYCSCNFVVKSSFIYDFEISKCSIVSQKYFDPTQECT